MNSYTFERFKSACLGTLLFFISIFVPKDKNTWIFTSQLSRGFDKGPRELFLLAASLNDGVKPYFYIKKPELIDDLDEVSKERILSGTRLSDWWKICRAKVWVVSSFDMPLGGFFHRYQRTIFHLGHGAPLKKVGFGAWRGNLLRRIYYTLIKTNISYVVSSSVILDQIWLDSFGFNQSRIKRHTDCAWDAIIHNRKADQIKSKLPSGSKALLYAPTWDPGEAALLFPFSDFDVSKLNLFLKRNNLSLFIRAHPFYSDLDWNRIALNDRIHLLGRADCPDINDALDSVDFLLTDRSSLAIDFLCTRKPSLFLLSNQKMQELEGIFSIDVETQLPGLICNTFDGVIEEIEALLESKDHFQNKRQEMYELYGCIDKLNSKQLFDMISREVGRKQVKING